MQTMEYPMLIHKHWTFACFRNLVSGEGWPQEAHINQMIMSEHVPKIHKTPATRAKQMAHLTTTLLCHPYRSCYFTRTVTNDAWELTVSMGVRFSVPESHKALPLEASVGLPICHRDILISWYNRNILLVKRTTFPGLNENISVFYLATEGAWGHNKVLLTLLHIIWIFWKSLEE